MTGAPRPTPHPLSSVAYDSNREMRRRLAIGATGLLLMLLLVILAGLLSGEARQEAEVAKAQAQAVGVSNPGGGPAAPPSATDPLAEAPENADGAAVVPPTDAPLLSDGNGSVIVPDLQPDPRLEAKQPPR